MVNPRRKVVLRLKGRDHTDSVETLRAVDQAFHPNEIEDTLQTTASATESVPTVPDEQLETKLSQVVANSLEECNAEAGEPVQPDPEILEAPEKLTSFQQLRKWINEQLPKDIELISRLVIIVRTFLDFLGR